MIKKYIKTMCCFLTMAFCIAGTVVADNVQIGTGIQYPQDTPYIQKLKEDPFMQTVANKLTGRFVGTNGWILHLSMNNAYRIQGSLEFDGTLYYVNGMISSEELVGNHTAVVQEFSFLLREKGKDYQLMIKKAPEEDSESEKLVSASMKKQTVSELEKLYQELGESWLGKDDFYLTFTQRDNDKYAGVVNLEGNSMPFTGKLERSGLCGEMRTHKRNIPFIITLGKNSPVFLSEHFNTELIPTSEKKLAPSPGKDFMISLGDKVDLEMVGIKPGTFMMGSPVNEEGRFDGEVLHKVTLTKGYWLGRYEVTQAQYKAVTGTNPSKFRGDNNPVETVSWNDAMEFCKKLTEIEKAAGRLPEGYEYTLPTEAQWEYACRAGTTGKYNIEGAEMYDLAWYGDNGGRKTHPVGQKLPNAWGLYDIHGNVWEWCLDWGGDYPTSAVTDPTGPIMGERRVIRGGSWDCYARFCRSANQGTYAPGNRISLVGFRVCLSY